MQVEWFRGSHCAGAKPQASEQNALAALRVAGSYAAQPGRHGEMVNTADLKSAAPKGACGFESHCRYQWGGACRAPQAVHPWRMIEVTRETFRRMAEKAWLEV